MSNKPFHYQAPFLLKGDDTKYYLLTSEHVSVSEFEGQRVLKVVPEALTLLMHQALHDASSMLRPVHQQQVADILRGLEASKDDKYMALQFLRNSDIAAKGALPTCQDTGIAIIVSKEGQRVWTGGGDEAALARGVYSTYIEDNLHYSQSTPLGIYKEVSTGTNLSAQIDLYAISGDEYEFLCIVKDGGSANRTYLYQETKALLTPRKLRDYLVEKVRALGTVVCSSYHIALVIGGTSAKANLKAMKPASAKYYDELPTEENEHGQAFRDMELEKKLLIEAQNLGLGVQFGDRYLAHGIRVTHLPRHDASCLVGMDISCSADRNIKTKINRQGIWIKKLEHSPGKYISEELRKVGEGETVCIDLNRPMKKILVQLSQYPVSIRLSFDGIIIAGHNIAHAKLKERMDDGEGLSQYIKDYPTYCAGPARTLKDCAPGSLDPMTAERMNSYIDQLQAQDGSMIMLAKGDRSQQVTDVCKKHGSFYLGNIDGPVTALAQGSIKSSGCVEYSELGMETIWKIEMEDFPVFILVDDRGDGFFQQIQLTQCTCYMKQTEPSFETVLLHGTEDQTFVIKW